VRAASTMSSFQPVRAEVVVSPAPAPMGSSQRARHDERMKPMAAVLFRALREAESLSWLECLALMPEGETNVGQVIVWLRFHQCDIEAKYVAGETRFYLVGVVPLTSGG
jgi:hypothetical protein